MAKTLFFLQGFVHVTTFDFLKNAEIPAFFAFIKAKHRFNKCKKCCNLQGFGAVTGKKTCKYQRFGVRKWLKHRYLQCFVPSTFSWNCKNSVNTSIFCDRLAKNAVIYSVFLLGFQKHWYLRCFVHLRFKKYWYLQHFLFFFIAPAKDVKTQKCCTFRKAKNRPKKVSKRHFFSILGTLKTGGGMLLETLMSDPDSGQKALPHPPEGFLVFFGARRRRVGGWGRASP